MTPTLSLGSSTLQNGQTTTLTVGIPAGAASGTIIDIYVDSYMGATDYTTTVVGVQVP